MNIVIAPSYKAFEWWCVKKGIDPSNRREVIPLIDPSDRYRLYGRALRAAKLIVVNRKNIDHTTYLVFRTELAKHGFVDPGRVHAGSPNRTDVTSLDGGDDDAVPHDVAGPVGE